MLKDLVIIYGIVIAIVGIAWLCGQYYWGIAYKIDNLKQSTFTRSAKIAKTSIIWLTATMLIIATIIAYDVLAMSLLILWLVAGLLLVNVLMLAALPFIAVYRGSTRKLAMQTMTGRMINAIFGMLKKALWVFGVGMVFFAKAAMRSKKSEIVVNSPYQHHGYESYSQESKRKYGGTDY